MISVWELSFLTRRIYSAVLLWSGKEQTSAYCCNGSCRSSNTCIKKIVAIITTLVSIGVSSKIMNNKEF